MNNKWKIGLYSVTIFYVATGIYHFVNPAVYKKIMPPWMPWHYPLIYISGALEVLFGLLLIPNQTRKWAAWGIIILLVVVFPANIQMMLNYHRENNPGLWIAIVRLPLQLLLIAWAWSYTRKRKE